MFSKKLSLPIYESILYLIFLAFSFISVIYAIDKEVALEKSLIYFFTFLVFIFAFNLKDKVKNKIPIAITGLSFILMGVFFVSWRLKWGWLSDSNGLFYTGYTHLQLGNFFVLGLIASPWAVLSLVFFVMILFSYSRTAYLSLLLLSPLIFSAKKNILPLFLLILMVLFFLLATSKNILFTKDKSLLGNRNIYFGYALSAIKENPWFGIGPGNFYFAASKRQVNFEENTTTAHNLFFDIFAENGILAGLAFVGFIGLILLRSKKNKNYYLLLALTLIFMTDFSYQYLLFFFTYFILLGVSVSENQKTIKGNTIIFLLILAFFVFSQTHFLYRYFFLKGNLEKALRLNPYQKELYKEIINEKINAKDMKGARKYLHAYNRFFGQSFNTLFDQAIYWEMLSDRQRSLAIRSRIFYLRPLNIGNIEKIYEFGGEKYFLSLIKDYFKKNPAKKNTDLARFINIFCREYKLSCQINFL